ncbi:MAG: hypothetical protein IT443_03665 [Phycisphaeraceae bacterium]|nr:hypothetical protein [Phycisphaeraceae bacterium]
MNTTASFLSPRRPLSPTGRLYVVALYLAVGLSLGGCVAAGVLASGVAKEKVKARYRLPDQKTLVLVDDPKKLLGDPSAPAAAANRVAFDLIEKETLLAERFVAQEKLTAMIADLGPAYARMPIDQVGKKLDAATVIYVYIDSVQMQSEPGIYRPTAQARVKVIDTATGKRLFPAPGSTPTNTSGNTPASPPPPTPPADLPESAKINQQALLDPMLTEKGWPINATVSPQTQRPGVQGQVTTLTRNLADRIGVEVARLFMDYYKDKANQ